MRQRHQTHLSVIKSEAGVTLIEIVMAIGSIAFVASLTATLYLQMSKSKNRLDLQSELVMLRDQYANILENDTAWQNTINDASFPHPCLRDKTPCVANGVTNPALPAGYAFTPRMSDTTLYLGYDSAQGNAGFDRNGRPCNTWVDGVPDINCPTRIDFIWQPICPADPKIPCVDPESEVTIFFRIQIPANSGYTAVNSGSYTRRIRRKGSITTPIVYFCAKTTDVVIGFDLNGQPVCVDGATVKP